MLLRFTALALSLLTAPALAAAQEVDLAPKYEQGQKLVYDTEVQVNQTLTLAGMNVETGVTTFETKNLEVLEKSDTATKLKLYSSKMQFDLSLPGGITVSFDSENPDKNNGADLPGIGDLTKLLKVASKLQMTVDVSNEGKIKELSLEAEGLDTLPETMKSYMSSDRLKPQIEQELTRFPADKVKPGDTWTKSEVFDAGQGQYFAYTTTYKYEGRVEQDGQTYDKVTCTYDKPRFDIEAGSSLPITVKSSDLSMKGSSTTILLNVKDHHADKVTNKSIFKGKLVFAGPDGSEIPGELDLTVESKMTRKAE